MSKSNTGHLRLADRITVSTVVLQNVALWETGSSGHFYMHLSKNCTSNKDRAAEQGAQREAAGDGGETWSDPGSLEEELARFIEF